LVQLLALLFQLVRLQVHQLLVQPLAQQVLEQLLVLLLVLP